MLFEITYKSKQMLFWKLQQINIFFILLMHIYAIVFTDNQKQFNLQIKRKDYELQILDVIYFVTKKLKLGHVSNLSIVQTLQYTIKTCITFSVCF